MKKLSTALVMALSVFALTGCSYFSSTSEDKMMEGKEEVTEATTKSSMEVLKNEKVATVKSTMVVKSK